MQAVRDDCGALAELVSTPFMQQIVVNILHRLQAAGNPAEPALKTELHTLLSHGIWSNIGGRHREDSRLP